MVKLARLCEQRGAFFGRDVAVSDLRAVSHERASLKIIPA
jgi:hypothetical protein